jgi:hypothetical protein
MKVYSISKWAFYLIFLLIILLPVSLQWKLLVNGSTAKGTVTNYTILAREVLKDQVIIEHASEVTFSVKDQEYHTYGPKNYEYDLGRMLKIRYNPEDPDNNCILSFTGIYLRNYTTLPLILLILWAAFYLSFNRYSKRKTDLKKGNNSDGRNVIQNQLK